QVGEVRYLDALWDLRLRQALRVDDGLFVLDLLPFERLLTPGDVEAFPVLPGRVEQAARDLGHHVGIADLEGRRLDRKGAAVAGDQLLADAAGAVADDTLGVLTQDGQAGADAVRGVVHGRQTRPVVGPAVHVLLMAATQELDAAQLALVVQLLGEEVLPAVNDGLHHHVDFAGLALRLDDLPAFVDGRRHRHGAGDVLARLEGGEALRGVVGNGGV